LATVADIIALAGGVNKLARLVGVAHPTVSGWRDRHGRIPAQHVVAICLATGLTPYDIRPDVFLAEWRVPAIEETMK